MQNPGLGYEPNGQFYYYYYRYHALELYGTPQDAVDVDMQWFSGNAGPEVPGALYTSDGYLWNPAQGNQASPWSQPAGVLHSSRLVVQPDGFRPKDWIQLTPVRTEASLEERRIDSPGSPPQSWAADGQPSASGPVEQIHQTSRVDELQTEPVTLSPEPSSSPVSSSLPSFPSPASLQTSLSAPGSPLIAPSAAVTDPIMSVPSSGISEEYEDEPLTTKSLPVVSLGCGRWKCEICDAKFRRKQRVITHYWSKHGNIRLSCDGRCGESHCPKTFATRDSFCSHVKPIKVKCDGCGRSLLKKNILRHRDQHCHP